MLPDVYQGTTNANAGVLAVVPKIAALVALVRIVYVAMPGFEQLGWQLTLAVAMVTMTLGNLLALWQTNVRRMMAYSSIAHAGYMLIGLAVGFAVAGGASEAEALDGVGATLFYLLVYAAATAGTFAALTYLSGDTRSRRHARRSGRAQQHAIPRRPRRWRMFMFSLTGLPPLAGFWGKFTLFTGALGVDARNPEAGNLWPWFVALAIVGVIERRDLGRVLPADHRRDVLPPSDESRPRGAAAWGPALATLAVRAGRAGHRRLSRPAGRGRPSGQPFGSRAAAPVHAGRRATSRQPAPHAKPPRDLATAAEPMLSDRSRIDASTVPGQVFPRFMRRFRRAGRCWQFGGASGPREYAKRWGGAITDEAACLLHDTRRPIWPGSWTAAPRRSTCSTRIGESSFATRPAPLDRSAGRCSCSGSSATITRRPVRRRRQATLAAAVGRRAVSAAAGLFRTNPLGRRDLPPAQRTA